MVDTAEVGAFVGAAEVETDDSRFDGELEGLTPLIDGNFVLGLMEGLLETGFIVTLLLGFAVTFNVGDDEPAFFEGAIVGTDVGIGWH